MVFLVLIFYNLVKYKEWEIDVKEFVKDVMRYFYECMKLKNFLNWFIELIFIF